MRRLALTVLLAALWAGCESKTPLGPGAVTVTRSTSTTTSTTTSTIPPSTTANFIFSPLTPAALEVVSFNAFGSTAAPGRTIVSYSWDFGDGQSKTGVSVTHDFFPQGLYIVTLTVTDSAGEQASVSKPIGAGVPLPSTTTTTIPTTTSAHYVSTQADPEIPADLTLFFQLLTAPVLSPLSSARTNPAGLAGRGDVRFGTLADSRYSVQGTYSKRNGETGTISGELVGTLTPEPAGTFTGTLTATNVNGCTAARNYSGPISNASLQWTGATPWNPPCQPDQFAFSSVNLVKTDAPPTIPTTSTTSTSTTSVLCNYSLNPVSVTLPARDPSGAAGSAFQTTTVGITTAAGCGWNMQTNTPWITLLSPTVGSGPATVSFQVANNTDGQRRVGSVVIAGITFLVTQDAETIVEATSSTTTSSLPSTTSSVSTTTTTVIGPAL